MNTRSKRLGLSVWAAVLGTFLFTPTVRAAEELSPKVKALLEEARTLRDKGDLAGALEKYYKVHRAEPNLPEEALKEYQDCLRRVQQYRRLRDKPSQEMLGDLRPSEALDVYADILKHLGEKYYDVKKFNYEKLFKDGVREMRLALEDEAFLKEQVAADKPAALAALRAQLEGLRPAIKKPAEACDQLRSVMLWAQRDLGIKPAAVLVEFIAGACNSLDEYTGYLSPTRLAEIEADLNGKNFVGIGVDLDIYGNKDGKHLIITRVYENSPAYGKIFKDEEILSIDGANLTGTAPAMLVAKLQGEPGTMVELELRSTAGMMRVEKIARQAVAIPSVEIVEIDAAHRVNGVGCLHISSFQHGTPQELRSEMLRLRQYLRNTQSTELKALILDLRGNLGGSFAAAREVAEMFLSEGTVIVYTRRKAEAPWKSTNKDPLQIPLVVLVDGDTASAAEIVAGALKDNDRAKLVGQPTFGKGSIQCLLTLETLKAGLQITVARFSSPKRVPYDGHGITPHELIENSMMMPMMRDQQMARAIELAEMSPMLKMR